MPKFHMPRLALTDLASVIRKWEDCSLDTFLEVVPNFSNDCLDRHVNLFMKKPELEP